MKKMKKILGRILSGTQTKVQNGFTRKRKTSRKGIRKEVFLAFVLMGITVLLGATDVSGSVNGTWNLAGSPYIINGEIDLQIGNELGIEPGVEVQFSGYYKFNVYGRLLAEGDSTNAISFTAQNTVVGWHGLRFFDTSANGQS